MTSGSIPFGPCAGAVSGTFGTRVPLRDGAMDTECYVGLARGVRSELGGEITAGRIALRFRSPQRFLDMLSDGTAAREVTALLDRLDDGDEEALDRVFPLIYQELYILARRQRQRWEGDFTLNTTALVHEAYLKLVGRDALGVKGRGHFFALASRAMRHILCNYGRDRNAKKRGGGLKRVSLEQDGVELPARGQEAGEDLLQSLERGLTALERVHPRPARVVECRFFGGLSVEETATALEVSPRTVKRDWQFAQAFLKKTLEADS